MKKFSLISLGCPKNLTDSEEIAARLVKTGYELSFFQGAEVSVINTCAFLKSAVKESQKHIEEQIKLKKKGVIKKVIVAGCLVERLGEKLLEKYPEIDAVLGVSSLDKAKDAVKGKSYILKHSNIYSSSRILLTKNHSAYLKIADGCDNRCAYCTIPSIRGPLRSKPQEEIISEAKALAESGAVEISLIAQDITAYGKEIYGKPQLESLLKKLSKIKKVKWFRLMYAYPEGINENCLKLIRDRSNICHYLELPIQHISDSVLKKMNRRSDEKSIRKKIDLIRKIVPDMAIRSAFIAGFPGETEKDFKKLLSFVKETEFSSAAFFEYSREEGTPAFSFKHQIPAAVKKERTNILLSAQAAVVDKLNKRLLNKDLEILADGDFEGRAYFQAPDIDGRIETDYKMEAGRFYKCKIRECRGYIRKAILTGDKGPKKK